MPAPEPLLVSLGETLRALRIERNLSQEELSLRTGVHRNYIGGIERAERQPTVSTMSKLADALDIPLSDLLQQAETRQP